MIDHTLPMHQQIANHLRAEIDRKEFEPGDKLPSEKRLGDYFKVSRITVRQALKALENEGLIFKKQGLGAFVKEKFSVEKLVQLTDFSEDMRKAGYSSSSKLIKFKRVNPILEINNILSIPPTSPLIRIDRLRFADSTPVSFDITWLPASYGQLLLDEDLSSNTIYQILEEKYSIPIIAGRYKFTATSADSYVSSHLNIEEGSPIFEIDRCSKTTGGKKIYYQRRFNNPEFISYEIELSRGEEIESSSKNGLPLKEFSPKFSV